MPILPTLQRLRYRVFPPKPFHQRQSEVQQVFREMRNMRALLELEENFHFNAQGFFLPPHPADLHLHQAQDGEVLLRSVSPGGSTRTEEHLWLPNQVLSGYAFSYDPHGNMTKSLRIPNDLHISEISDAGDDAHCWLILSEPLPPHFFAIMYKFETLL